MLPAGVGLERAHNAGPYAGGWVDGACVPGAALDETGAFGAIMRNDDDD